MTDESMPPPSTPPPMQPPAPPPGFAPSAGESSARLPWEDRQSLGFAAALVETVRMIVTEPGEAFGRLRRDGDYVSPLLFGGLIAWVAAIIGQIWSMLFSGMFAGLLGVDPAASLGGGTLQLVLVTVLFPFFFGIGLLISVAIFHGCLLLVGGASQSEFGVEGTFKVICYSQLASLGGIVPILGFLIVIVAQVIFLVVGFQKVHGASQGQALGATLLPMVLCCICVVLAFMLGFAGILAAAAGAGG